MLKRKSSRNLNHFSTLNRDYNISTLYSARVWRTDGRTDGRTDAQAMAKTREALCYRA